MFLSGKKKMSNVKKRGIMAGKKDKENKEVLCEDLAGEKCGLKKVIDIVGGKWKIMILCVLSIILSRKLKA